jgi:hypothetical protein
MRCEILHTRFRAAQVSALWDCAQRSVQVGLADNDDSCAVLCFDRDAVNTIDGDSSKSMSSGMILSRPVLKTVLLVHVHHISECKG